MIVFAKAMIKLPSIETPSFIRNNPKLYPFFEDCLGSVDGSHYNALPPAEFTEVFRNRKGQVTTNVMAAVDFKGRFIQILAGWEGSAHDWKVYVDAVQEGFIIPKGKFLLADAGYNSSHRLLTPYRGIRYHLQESARHGLRPETPEELYNLRHSQARIIVEKAIGGHKATFRILTSRPCHPIWTQVKILYATAALMNWIIDYGDAESLPDEIDEDPPQTDNTLSDINSQPAFNSSEAFTADEVEGGEGGTMAGRRRDIARAMWLQYDAYLRTRGVE